MMTSDRFVGLRDYAAPPEAEPKCWCGKCGEPLFEGDRSYMIDGKRLCVGCVEDLMELV